MDSDDEDEFFLLNGSSAIPIDFVITKFDKSITSQLAATIPTYTETFGYADAVAVYEVPTQTMRHVFKFRTDASDIDTDISPLKNDVAYKVNFQKFPNVNPAHASLHNMYLEPLTFSAAANDNLGTGPISDGDNLPSRSLIKHDYLRYISQSIFRSVLGIKFLNNTQEVLDGIAVKGQQAYLQMLAELKKADGMTNFNDGVTNLGKTLLEQIAAFSPERLQNLQNTADYQAIPFQDGDTLQFNFILLTSPEQTSIVNSTAPIPKRTYRIVLHMRNTTEVRNITVDDLMINLDSVTPEITIEPFRFNAPTFQTISPVENATIVDNDPNTLDLEELASVYTAYFTITGYFSNLNNTDEIYSFSQNPNPIDISDLSGNTDTLIRIIDDQTNTIGQLYVTFENKEGYFTFEQQNLVDLTHSIVIYSDVISQTPWFVRRVGDNLNLYIGGYFTNNTFSFKEYEFDFNPDITYDINALIADFELSTNYVSVINEGDIGYAKIYVVSEDNETYYEVAQHNTNDNPHILIFISN
jgi:hypothetical protein